MFEHESSEADSHVLELHDAQDDVFAAATSHSASKTAVTDGLDSI